MRKLLLHSIGIAALILLVGSLISIILLKLFGVEYTIYGIIIAFTLGGFGSVGYCSIKEHRKKKQLK